MPLVAARRWVLLSLALLSLAILAYGGVSMAFSVKVDARMVDAMRLPGAASPAVGERALVVPFPDGADAASVPVFADANASESFGARGAVLLLADGAASFPSDASNATLARALAHVELVNGSYSPATITFAGLPGANGENVTVDVLDLAKGETGFLVKGDNESSVRFVEAGRVVGQVARFDPAGAYYTILVVGGLGFVLPLAFLILTHRGAGQRGLPGGAPGIAGAVGACPECRAPIEAGQDFCTRCGAWLRPRGGA